MKKNLQISFLVFALAFALNRTAAAQAISATQNPLRVNTQTRILYHDGPVMYLASNVYFIWYGCWDETCRTGNTATKAILDDFIVNLGSSPYFQMNTLYPGSIGIGPSGSLLFGGEVFDRYSHGLELTAADVQAIVSDQIESGHLPPDSAGIYVVLASADVSSGATGFCVAGAFPHHGVGFANGSRFWYAFVGHPTRCPSLAAPQFLAAGGTQLPTPNGNLAADAMVSTIAHLMNVTVTNPDGTGWFDRYGLQNADKCEGQFGPTYLVNGGRANIRLGQRDYLIQQNWVNDRRGHCAMNTSL